MHRIFDNFSIDYIGFEHKRKDKIEDVDINLYVKSNGVTHKIWLHDCLKSDCTWLMGNEIYWKAHKKSLLKYTIKIGKI